MFEQKLWRRNYENFSTLFLQLKNVYDNDDRSAVTYTTINRMEASFTKLCESLKKNFL